MNKGFFILVLGVFITLPIIFLGCKGKVEEPRMEDEAALMMQEVSDISISEPAETIAMETIPPTAEPQIEVKPKALQDELTRNRNIQKALKNAGLYAGAIDGVVGPKTKKAVEEFQKTKGLKVDGKVGPKTWAELEKYLTR